METLERLERADRELAEQWRIMSVALDAQVANTLTFSEAEEAALEERFGDALAGLQAAVRAGEELARELTDPVEAAETARSVKFFEGQAKRHVVNVRKLLVAYSQRAKRERLEQARAGLMSKRAGGKSDASSAAAQGSALDVTAALKRTRQVMAQEIDRMSSATKVLDDGRSSLRSSHEELGGVQSKLAEWQARQDKMWIAAGIAVLASTVLFIVHERTGLFIF
ncbi:hypothetical protein PybrP1_011648 [[Pythium] brassicae (nom. inval.)]|nr:hypothetical protein PybrP1_011648 [[Pythium] brassicae (nom. inval.)]